MPTQPRDEIQSIDAAVDDHLTGSSYEEWLRQCLTDLIPNIKLTGNFSEFFDNNKSLTRLIRAYKLYTQKQIDEKYEDDAQDNSQYYDAEIDF